MRVQASEVFPSIKQGITDLTENFSASVTQSAREIESATKRQNETITALNHMTVEITGNVKKSLLKGADELQEKFSQAAENIKEASSKSFETFDKQTQDSLSKVIKYMGDNLASIHEKILNDCQEITSELARINKKS